MLTAPAPAAPADEPIEEVIGDAVAAAAIALMAAVQEWQVGGQRLSTPAIKQKSKTGGDLIAQLYQLRQATLGEIADFEEVARAYGQQALRARCNGAGYTKGCDVLLDSVFEILGRVTATMAAGPPN